jgi:hypothetical protein
MAARGGCARQILIGNEARFKRKAAKIWAARHFLG